MELDIENDPGNAVVTVPLNAGERVEADPGTMISRSESVESATEGTSEGATGMRKSALSDELDVTETVFTAGDRGGCLTLGPDLPGDIGRIDLAETGRVKVQSGGVVAWTPDDPLVVDEDHLLAWTDGLDVSRTEDSSVKSPLIGGEGFVTRFAGTGRVRVQTRDPLVIGGTGGQ